MDYATKMQKFQLSQKSHKHLNYLFYNVIAAKESLSCLSTKKFHIFNQEIPSFRKPARKKCYLCYCHY